jgi:hypothetical protein
MGGAEAGVQPMDEGDRQGEAEGRCVMRPSVWVWSRSPRARSGPHGPNLGGGIRPDALRSLARGDVYTTTIWSLCVLPSFEVEVFNFLRRRWAVDGGMGGCLSASMSKGGCPWVSLV